MHIFTNPDRKPPSVILARHESLANLPRDFSVIYS